jgi:hypothetical protein
MSGRATILDLGGQRRAQRQLHVGRGELEPAGFSCGPGDLAGKE